MKQTHNSPQRLEYLKRQLPTDITRMVSDALKEDLGGSINPNNDITAQLIASDTVNTATIITREAGIFCGKEWVIEVFKQLESALTQLNEPFAPVTIDWQVKDGDNVTPNQALCTLTGSARLLLTGERTAMNFIQTLSGCATTTAVYVEQLKGTNCRLLDTRKTLPGLRNALKYAVTCGGGFNHRIGVFDAYLIKENHIIACGGLEKAIATAKQAHPDKPVEIETESLQELKTAIRAGADIVMLDNFTKDMMIEAVAINKAIGLEQGLNEGAAALENSGNITLTTINEYAKTGVDYISVGALTKHVKAMDLSMRMHDSE